MIRRQQFKDRTWKKGEAFGDYFHEKIILANNVPIGIDDELIDYIILGIPNPALRDQELHTEI